MDPIKPGDNLSRYESDPTNTFGTLVGIGGILTWLVAIGLIAYKGILWLRFGDYPSWVIGDYAHLKTSWVGLGRIFAWLEGWPLEGGLIALGLAMMFFGFNAASGRR